MSNGDIYSNRVIKYGNICEALSSTLAIPSIKALHCSASHLTLNVSNTDETPETLRNKLTKTLNNDATPEQIAVHKKDKDCNVSITLQLLENVISSILEPVVTTATALRSQEIYRRLHPECNSILYTIENDLLEFTGEDWVNTKLINTITSEQNIQINPLTATMWNEHNNVQGVCLAYHIDNVS